MIPGWPELIVIFLIVVIIFGAGKLPEIGSGIGKGIRNFKDSIKSPDSDSKAIADKDKDSGKES